MGPTLVAYDEIKPCGQTAQNDRESQHREDLHGTEYGTHGVCDPSNLAACGVA